MNPFRKIFCKLNKTRDVNYYEFCPRCDANLTMQKGYDNALPYWICTGCGEMLINPEIEDDIAWICDRCGCMLNIQPKFKADCGSWTCTECGYQNDINESKLYITEDEYQTDLKNPYKGMSDEAVLCLMQYEEVEYVANRQDIILVKLPENDTLYVKKILTTYDVNVYRYLLDHPIAGMPKLYGLFEGDNCLIIIEEYIFGKTLSEILEDRCLAEAEVIPIAIGLCGILNRLHRSTPPIIHRDIKPSNLMITPNQEVYLIDVNVAKCYKQMQSEDTKLLGTLHYAAPEQFGYGFTSSSAQSDIYSLGIMMNVMLTGKLPKEQRAEGKLWTIINKCISLDPSDRYSDQELLEALMQLSE